MRQIEFSRSEFTNIESSEPVEPDIVITGKRRAHRTTILEIGLSAAYPTANRILWRSYYLGIQYSNIYYTALQILDGRIAESERPKIVKATLQDARDMYDCYSETITFGLLKGSYRTDKKPLIYRQLFPQRTVMNMSTKRITILL